MLINGEWCPEGTRYTLKLGDVFLGHVYQRGGTSIYAGCWIAVLNGRQLTDSANFPGAKSMVEWEIINQLRFIVPGYRIILARRKESDRVRQVHLYGVVGPSGGVLATPDDQG
jgi:hypothetical protein